ncbi:MAG: NUDIX hydrolase [Pseudanabaena sp. M135S2SP2A07QC]|nr:NUDIX hydrolase [Pseudanabaena sp. M090S1SP2A07QC]MCA6507515.1 NUDIX hydrolase [Pseudanabaena sp. M172S2SP2A07QC]MCA6522649.1 NUDIX hydrolase [Pseudanabaena sp. M051S1SP2A07QC]MCA6525598.1 NUDIX hydrolase [Pseudanabaena sp. M179S2SP2A07QC]MCA6529782.1 NUDIX hydrolase [Pseudanabaena sp. M125S2SP2A07QC]MCA6533142.1 NUDIX hydrolase [Pseudanabaena sp. M176S2SP2A07QC]MCA6539558.1 NUDIX hydrolase [Pseudanabaena sp. M037S2SP2A07QC]MCA6544445.1 NUDIX hydrolase [Pseudanabaena sp. M074S1SP2A07QC]M
MYNYEYPRPALTVDCIVFGLNAQQELKVMLIQRDIPPFQGQWAIPGGFVRIDETLEEAALRELQEETGIHHIFLEQLYTFGDLGRDPRDRTVTVAYFALINLVEQKIQASTDARAAEWFAISNIPQLAFDHNQILQIAIARLRSKIRYEPIGFELLPQNFSLSQLQRLYETVLDRPLDKRNFRKKILGMDLLIDTGKVEHNVAHRAAKLYQFDENKYLQLKQKGFNFEI